MGRKIFVTLILPLLLSSLSLLLPEKIFAADCVPNTTVSFTPSCAGVDSEHQFVCLEKSANLGTVVWCCATETECNGYLTKVGDITCGKDGKGISTAIGCLPVLGSTNEFLSSLLKWAVGVGGGIAFLLMLYAGFMTMTASGNPERLKAGQELLTSAVAGLILLVFSVFILRFIGVDILGLDAFGFGK